MSSDNERKVVDYMLSTEDNPFDPFTEFKSWLSYDLAKGYNTCGYLARVSETSDLSDREERLAIHQAIEDAVRYNFPGRLIIVTRPAKDEYVE